MLPPGIDLLTRGGELAHEALACHGKPVRIKRLRRDTQIGLAEKIKKTLVLDVIGQPDAGRACAGRQNAGMQHAANVKIYLLVGIEQGLHTTDNGRQAHAVVL